ncbi:uncharacterized protein [Typha angustifolia]|uniref:uncharacterized protein n=1 Tax=Typha angustifolia TaxID=59011 RepID=UPI003C2BED96
MVVQRLRSSGSALFRTVSPSTWTGESLALPNLKRKASNTWSAVQDTFLSTKEVFESHRVVFTVGTSIASILTAWAGYSLRQLHQSKVERRLESIEQSLKNSYNVEHEEIKKIVSSGNVSTTACIATACTSLVLGYGLGWRGGAWYTNRKFRKEQLKLMGQMKPRRWKFLGRHFVRFRSARPVLKTTGTLPKANAESLTTQHVQKSC